MGRRSSAQLLELVELFEIGVLKGKVLAFLVAASRPMMSMMCSPSTYCG
jgi:hypothetical protein